MNTAPTTAAPLAISTPPAVATNAGSSTFSSVFSGAAAAGPDHGAAGGSAAGSSRTRLYRFLSGGSIVTELSPGAAFPSRPPSPVSPMSGMGSSDLADTLEQEARACELQAERLRALAQAARADAAAPAPGSVAGAARKRHASAPEAAPAKRRADHSPDG